MLDDIDRALFRLAQSEFPITERPFRNLGRKLKLTEEETLLRLRKLKEQGLIRRIGPVWDAKSLGLSSLLIAFKVPAGRVEKAAAIINRSKGVTHNYLREAEYNLWFTLTAMDEKALKRQLQKLVRRAKPLGVLKLPATIIYKIGVKLEA
jgi:DNA-binding Lrp family transcriptional regulator